MASPNYLQSPDILRTAFHPTLPPFNTIDGMGDKAAEAMEIAAKDGPYLSKDDFRQRTKVSKTLVDLMADMGLLGDLPETNQLSLFDFA